MAGGKSHSKHPRHLGFSIIWHTTFHGAFLVMETLIGILPSIERRFRWPRSVSTSLAVRMFAGGILQNTTLNYIAVGGIRRL